MTMPVPLPPMFAAPLLAPHSICTGPEAGKTVEAELLFDAPCDVDGCGLIARWTQLLVKNMPGRDERGWWRAPSPLETEFTVDCPAHPAEIADPAEGVLAA